MHLYLLLVALPVATLAINPCKYGSYDFTSLISRALSDKISMYDCTFTFPFFMGMQPPVTIAGRS
jgi:hypothetical protein